MNHIFFLKKLDSHTCTEISADINQTRYCICSEPWKRLSLQRQLQKLWSLLKEKKEKNKQEPQTVKASERGFWSFLEVSGRQWGAELPQREKTVIHPAQCHTHVAVSATIPNQHSMEFQRLICFETQAANTCLGVFPAVFSQKVLGQHSSARILSRCV